MDRKKESALTFVGFF